MDKKEITCTVEEYINSCPVNKQERFRAIRALILDLHPEFTEKIGYGMPGFYIKKKNIIYVGSFQNHIGLYPGPDAICQFEDRLSGYHTSKGTIQFPDDKNLDEDLIRDIVRYNLVSRLGN